MELLAALSDDQKALIGCATAFVLCGGIMSISYYLGQWRVRRQTVAAKSVHPVILKLQQQQQEPAPASDLPQASTSDQRRAA